jgi:hypothetical protein
MASRRDHAPAAGTFDVTASFFSFSSPLFSTTYANRRVRFSFAIEAAVASGSAPARNAAVGASWSCERTRGRGRKAGERRGSFFRFFFRGRQRRTRERRCDGPARDGARGRAPTRSTRAKGGVEVVGRRSPRSARVSLRWGGVIGPRLARSGEALGRDGTNPASTTNTARKAGVRSRTGPRVGRSFSGCPRTSGRHSASTSSPSSFTLLLHHSTHRGSTAVSVRFMEGARVTAGLLGTMVRPRVRRLALAPAHLRAQRRQEAPLPSGFDAPSDAVRVPRTRAAAP